MVAAVHELSICRAIAGIVADKAAGRPVERVRVDVGHLRQVVPETLIYSWDIAVHDSPLDGAVLDVNHVPAVLECVACEATSELTVPVFRCATCGSTDTKVVSGDELMITSFDLIGA
jgi:hydrogenase nickel incorporation protein HypA/HybF